MKNNIDSKKEKLIKDNLALYNQIVEFVAEKTFTDKQKINLSTRLGEDIGLDGIDAWEFFQAFQSRFRIDLNNFKFDKHFGPEAGFNPLWYLYMYLFKPKKLKLSPIQVIDLFNSALEGKWVSINSKNRS